MGRWVACRAYVFSRTSGERNGSLKVLKVNKFLIDLFNSTGGEKTIHTNFKIPPGTGRDGLLSELFFHYNLLPKLRRFGGGRRSKWAITRCSFQIISLSFVWICSSARPLGHVISNRLNREQATPKLLGLFAGPGKM